jgi:hypothetical protein
VAQTVNQTEKTPAEWRHAIDNAIAQQRLEGLTVPPETIIDLERASRGEITTAQIIEKTIARYTHGVGK